MKYIFVCSTHFHIYVTLLKCMMNKQGENHIYILDVLPNANEILCKLKKESFVSSVSIINDRELGVETKNIPRIIRILFLKHYLDMYFSKIILPDHDWIYIFWPNVFPIYLIWKYRNVILHEDGKNSIFLLHAKNWKSKILNIFRLRHFGNVEYHQNIKYVECQNINQLPHSLRHKFKQSDIGRLESQLNDEEKQIIANIFSVQIVPSWMYECSLLLTQPLFAHGFALNEEHQVEIYKKIIATYCKEDECIIIKPHPRDLVDYSIYDMGKKIYILKKETPFEVYKFIGVSFKKYITLWSTSIADIESSRVIHVTCDIDDYVSKEFSRRFPKIG